ncbi:MOSC domain-containing protein [Nesterenkonia sp. E16_7]|uniref:MOSC domain-containing protein n=1 Tax=unclassified Nesterenkonia TaxID=2629769 RepID=UPI001A929448|nr:MOSC domain-containing protein [Nesterenkonia sp. E16_10]MBO0597676.1 MOSC domain-containing protein [Nesterenkonia sp. E16_7]
MTEASPTCLAGAADRLGLTGTVDAVCVVHQLIEDAAGTVGVSGIDKRPVSGPVKVRTLGLHGDVQADRKHHGGTEKAVYAYAAEDAAWWATELGRDLPSGSFGENLRLSGIDLDGAHPGERWQIGDQVVLEATVPRIPCATFGRWLDQPGWVKRFIAAGRPGTYFKVITPGTVQAGDRAAVIAVAEAPGASIRETARREGPARARPND